METLRAAAARLDAVKVLRQAAIFLGGSFLLALGIIMIFLPGPGVAVMFAGLAVLATEYAWARRWLDRGRTAVEVVRARVMPRRAA